MPSAACPVAVPGVRVGDCGSFPGPDWMPKRAHQADLQAAAAARNLLDELAGRTASATFKVELVHHRRPRPRNVVYQKPPTGKSFCPSRFWHWMKRGFEGCTCASTAENL